MHGDLHTGSIMVTDDDTRVIDPEFAFYGPMALRRRHDAGEFLDSLLLASAAMRKDGDRKVYARLACSVWTVEIWAVFCKEFAILANRAQRHAL